MVGQGRLPQNPIIRPVPFYVPAPYVTGGLTLTTGGIAGTYGYASYTAEQAGDRQSAIEFGVQAGLYGVATVGGAYGTYRAARAPLPPSAQEITFVGEASSTGVSPTYSNGGGTLGTWMSRRTTSVAVAGQGRDPMAGYTWNQVLKARYGAANVEWVSPKLPSEPLTTGVLRTPAGEFELAVDGTDIAQ